MSVSTHGFTSSINSFNMTLAMIWSRSISSAERGLLVVAELLPGVAQPADSLCGSVPGLPA